MNEKPNLAGIVRYIVPKNVRTFDTFLQNESALKSQVKEFWNEKSCGEIYAVGKSLLMNSEHSQAMVGFYDSRY